MIRSFQINEMLEATNIWHYDHDPQWEAFCQCSHYQIPPPPHSHGNHHHVALNMRWSRMCVQRYLQMYWGPEGNEADKANVWQKTIIAWDRMGGGMSGDPLQGVSVHGEQGCQSCHPLGELRGRPPARHWPDRRAEGAPWDRLHPGIPTVVELPP